MTLTVTLTSGLSPPATLAFCYRNNVVVNLVRDDCHEVRCDRFHHPLVLIFVSVSVVGIRDATFLVILDPVHGIPSKPQFRDLRSMGPAQVVRCDLAADTQRNTDLTHGRIEPGNRFATTTTRQHTTVIQFATISCTITGR